MKNLLLIFGTFLCAGLSVAQSTDSAKSNASIKFETTSHSFGNIIEGQMATHEFVFTNTGTDPLLLTNVRASCGCTTPSWPREAIEPGKSATIRAEYNSNGRPGTFTKNIFVTSNGGESTLTISGNVVKEPEKPVSPIIIK